MGHTFSGVSDSYLQIQECTMLQKFSKCEVKALHGLGILQSYCHVKSNQISKSAILTVLETLYLEF